METGALVPVIWFFVLSFAACATIYLAVDRGDRPLQRRLQDLAVKFRLSEGHYDDQGLPEGGVAGNLLDWAQRRLPEPNRQKPAVEKLVNTLTYAGFESPEAPRVFQVIRLAVTVGGALLGYLIATVRGDFALIFIIVGAMLGYLAPLYYVRALARSRQTKIKREIADVIDLLVVCVECGLGLLAAIRIVGRECDRQGRIMGAQLARLSAELTAGSSLGEGLRAVAQRTGVDEIRTLSAILVQSEKLGTEMAQALRATADQLRIKRSMRAEEVAQKLPVKMIIPLICFLLPAMMLILVGPPMIQIFRSFNFR
jgi:tight adherence protein C